MKNQDPGESQKAMHMLSMGLLMGLGSVPVYALYSHSIKQFFVVLSIGWLLCGGATLVGGTLGFLFGIPRTLQQENDSTPAQTGLPAQTQSHPVSYRANTNLEQISDWLTKILVGVGLTQIDAIRQGFYELTLKIANGLGHAAHGQVFAGSLISFTVVLGFLFGYLWTRLHLAGAMRIADQAAIGALVESVQQVSVRAESASRKIEDLKQQTEHDAAALNLVYRQLNPSTDLPEVKQEKLDEALKLASRPIRVQAFNRAWKFRSDSWRDPSLKDKMKLTIPIFRALIHNDPDNLYHMNHGQLGFALKDMEPPEWEAAEAELSTAIRIRDERRETGWLYYEFVRAICRIMRDPDYQAGKPSTPKVRSEIVADLKAAQNFDEIKLVLSKTPDTGQEPSVAVIDKWLELNQLSKEKLLTGE